MVTALGESTQAQVKTALAVAQRARATAGDLHVRADQPVRWDAVSQVDQSQQRVTLPAMFLGTTWLGQDRSPSVRSPLVDDVTG
jgi:hypothetical protein